MNEPNAFSRTEMLVGSTGMENLKQSCILVFGAGGVGSHCIEALARSGVGTLFLVDNDVVSLTNINRQSIAFHSTLNRYKTELLKERIMDINPCCRVFTKETFVLPENLDALMQDVENAAKKVPDYIIDAVDTVAAKLALAEYAWKHHIPLLSSMGTGNKLHPELFELSDIYQTSVCPLCRVMRRELKKRQIPALEVLYSKELPLVPQVPEDREKETTGRRALPGSIAFVPPVAGLMIAGTVIRRICGQSNE